MLATEKHSEAAETPTKFFFFFFSYSLGDGRERKKSPARRSAEQRQAVRVAVATHARTRVTAARTQHVLRALRALWLHVRCAASRALCGFTCQRLANTESGWINACKNISSRCQALVATREQRRPARPMANVADKYVGDWKVDTRQGFGTCEFGAQLLRRSLSS